MCHSSSESGCSGPGRGVCALSGSLKQVQPVCFCKAVMLVSVDKKARDGDDRKLGVEALRGLSAEAHAQRGGAGSFFGAQVASSREHYS
jgi:hypothetical protein